MKVQQDSEPASPSHLFLRSDFGLACSPRGRRAGGDDAGGRSGALTDTYNVCIHRCFGSGQYHTTLCSLQGRRAGGDGAGGRRSAHAETSCKSFSSAHFALLANPGLILLCAVDEDAGREATTPAAVTALAQLGGSLPGLPALESLAIRREYNVVVPLAAHTERALCRLLGKAAATLSGGSHPLRCGRISGF